MSEQQRIFLLNPEVARKIAAGEVIDRPNAIVRELMDNAVDSGANQITVEINGGGIDSIRVVDNGCGMSRTDLQTAAHPHATSKIKTEQDLLNLTTLGFRGEALASMAAVGRLEIISGSCQMKASITEDHIITSHSPVKGTIVQVQNLFENFPARRLFLKRPTSEAILCRTMFEEKALPRTDINFCLSIDGVEKLNLPAGQTLCQRFIQTLGLKESSSLFYEVKDKDSKGMWSFSLVIGEPSVSRDNRKNIYIYVNGRRIQEYSLLQAIEYGCQGYFPNGSHPVACLFLNIDSSLVDFNIHPAKRECRFKDLGTVHHAVSTATKNFFKNYSVSTMVNMAQYDGKLKDIENQLGFEKSPHFEIADNLILEDKFPVINANDTKQVYQAENRSSFDNRSRFFGSSSRQTQNIFDSKSNSFKTYRPDAESIFDAASKSDSSNNLNSSFPIKAQKEGQFKYIGTALGTFIIAEKNNTLFIIDQHAADERLRFDQIIQNPGSIQQLLIPYVIKTERDEDDLYIESNVQKLKEAGFNCTKKSENTWEFSTVPGRWSGTEEDLQKDILEKRVDPKEIIRSIAASNACRSAVMDGMYLDNTVAADLAERALNLPDPHCPHGRPVWTAITREQLFSLVKRT